MTFFYDTTNTSTTVGQTTWTGKVTYAPQSPPGPLSRLQFRLQRRSFPLAWLGNRVSDVRCWLWRLAR